jgi:hypothetical protein
VAEAVIIIRPSRRFGQVLVTKPLAVTIDGEARGVARWRRASRFVVAPGHHVVTLDFPYLRYGRVGRATIELGVNSGASVSLSYRTPVVATGPGRVRID